MATASELSQLKDLCNTALGTDGFLVSGDGTGLTLGSAPSGGAANVIVAAGSSPGDFTLTLGNPSGTYTPDNHVGAAMFGGFPLELWNLALTVTDGGTKVANPRAAARIAIPFFVHGGKVEKIDVDLSIGKTGVGLVLAETQSDPARRNDEGKVVIDLTTSATGDPLLSSVALEVATTQISSEARDGKVWIILDGELAVKIEGDGSPAGDEKAKSFDLPKVEFKGLRISSDGEVGIDGGWLDLPKKAGINMTGFKLNAKKVGLGADKSADGTIDHWVGFDAEVSIGQALSIGGSVRGFKIGLDSGHVSFAGIDVEAKVPGVLEFKGSIDHVHAANQNDWDNQDSNIALPQGNRLGEIFPLDLLKGSLQLKILPIKLEIDGDFLTGHIGSAQVVAITMAASLTPGLPLFAGISLTGLQGLFAYNLRPDPASAGRTWWDWYAFPTDNSTGQIQIDAKSPGVDPNAPAAKDSSASDDKDGGDDDDPSSTGIFTATDLNKWMWPDHGAYAFGAGATIGSQATNGHLVSATVMFVFMMPGPVIMLVGTADILKNPKKSPKQPGLFNAMAVLDVEAGSFDMAIDVHYKKPAVVDVHGTAELFVKPSTGWYLALGKPRHDKRVSARFFDIFEVDAYFLIGDDGLQLGAYIGYDKSWDFGPLSVGVKAYIAGIAAVQWRPLEVGAGLEIHGEAHLSAFGIGVGASVDALIEGCAPSPFWVHGEFDVSISLPWPLPDISASIGLTWGGDDGTVPNPPLALSRLEAEVTDHRRLGDHWPLLVHGDHGLPDPMLDYEDPQVHGMLALSRSDATWAARVAANNGLDATPDIDDAHLAQGIVPMVPQDAHFTLKFSHPTVDTAGKNGAVAAFDSAAAVTTLPVEDTAIGPDVWDKLSPGGEMRDDMSNLTLSPPRPRYAYQNKLLQLAFYRKDSSGWTLVADSFGNGLPGVKLTGEWQVDNVPGSVVTQRPNIALHVRTVVTIPGDAGSADFTSVPYLKKLGKQFSVGGAAFSLDDGVEAWGIGAGIGLRVSLGKAGVKHVTIDLPQPERLQRIVGWHQVPNGEFWNYDCPAVSADGVPLGFTLDESNLPRGMIPTEIRAVRTLVITIPAAGTVVLERVEWKDPDRELPILPAAPALYGVKAVTQIDARRLGDNSLEAPAPGANPVIEFAYFQTVTGPGLVDLAGANLGAGPPTAAAIPVPDPPLDPKQAPIIRARYPEPGQSPRTGTLVNLESYVEWSWPGNGDRVAYYGYDLNVEFNESYVNALYVAAAEGSGLAGTAGRGVSSLTRALHLRCRDRNHNHTLVPTIAVTVPSAPGQSAVVGAPLMPPMPPAITGAATPRVPVHIREEVALVVDQRSSQAVASAPVGDGAQLGAPAAAIRSQRLSTPAQAAIVSLAADNGVTLNAADVASAGELSSGLQEIIRQYLLAAEAAAEARALWPVPLRPRARYEVDVVAGPIPVPGRRQRQLTNTDDPIAIRDALVELWSAEDSLTPLHTLHFATSRYHDFSAHMHGAVAQVSVPSTVHPVRRYQAASDAHTWLAGASSGEAARAAAQQAYAVARSTVDGFMNGFDPSAPGAETQLQQQRDTVEAAWRVYASASGVVFDGLVDALGLPELAGQRSVPPPPDTELSLIVDGADNVLAIVLHSPEPLPWRRLWNWTSLDPGDAAATPLDGVIPLWCGDGTRSLVLPAGTARGTYQLHMRFQGNIGPEIASITFEGTAVDEEVTFAPILFAKERVHHHPVHLTGVANRARAVHKVP
ncbi:MAG: hypothetical protein JF887_01865 [Candidatus Dormibacteraeota bacterium]|uniref:Uncharacterized protein n=1 Tax=Candidatus Amunia macphersoniae TaxID=3127014 RepID=A0A934KKF9_9BACT|nr:hypothetical protein [Candidatus Dormibacteraeota bacterium]